MGNTKSNGSARAAPWTFRPTLPPQPRHVPPSVLEAHERVVADLTAIYASLNPASTNRNADMISLMLDGHRARKQDFAELQRLAELGREWERHFPGIGPGQLASVFDLLHTRFGVHTASPAEGPSSPSPEVRRANINALVEALPAGDFLKGELG